MCSAIWMASARVRAPVLPMADQRWVRTTRSETSSFWAIRATEPPSRAARRVLVSPSLSGVSAYRRVSAARFASTTRRPRWTRRTASASWGAGLPLRAKPFAPAFEAAAEVAGAAVGGEHDDPAFRHRGAELGGHADAVVPGTGGVEQGDVRAVLLRGAHDVVGAVQLGDDLQVLFSLQSGSEHASAEYLVVDQQQPDAVGQTSLRGVRPGAGEVRPGGDEQNVGSRSWRPETRAVHINATSLPDCDQIATSPTPHPPRSLSPEVPTNTSNERGWWCGWG